jgi:hypothetical protein
MSLVQRAADETVDRISFLYPYTMVVWIRVAQKIRKQIPLPDRGLEEWWPVVVNSLPAARRMEVNYLVMLVLGSLWLLKTIVFNDHCTLVARTIDSFIEWHSCGYTADMGC